MAAAAWSVRSPWRRSVEITAVRSVGCGTGPLTQESRGGERFNWFGRCEERLAEVRNKHKQRGTERPRS